MADLNFRPSKRWTCVPAAMDAGILEKLRQSLRTNGRLPSVLVARNAKDWDDIRNIQMLPNDSQERKKIAIFRGFMAYFPLAIAECARLSVAANEKHNPGEELHWSKDKSDDHLDCLARHLLEVYAIDYDGFGHDVKVAWRAMANLETRMENDQRAKDENPMVTLGVGFYDDYRQHLRDLGLSPSEIAGYFKRKGTTK